MRQAGLTLVELLIGLVLIGIAAALAAPSFSALVDSQRRQDTAQQLVSGLRLARVEAILRSQPVIMQAQHRSWGEGWQVFVDTNRNQFRDDDEVIVAERSGHRNVTVVGNGRVSRRIGFDSSGRLLNNANGTLGVCLKDTAASHYQIAIAVTGRVTLRSSGFTTEPCA
ncbi:GspH/FimT family pseudopilin [Pseudomonas sp. SLFW]|uniref:GspH/FimT family pseudopilin n=1 Tax=Pseudomonas sp. SLFW TaxID=2683259 RepID=UPI001412D5B5|nr:GspH/FimT family pseudopilin [Pseudomonas sp. SLFW]NBB13291.1 prepilin-type N-terminal cleavage/methylation domain-containing protein [Pseudomonas sp. SLFW]